MCRGAAISLENAELRRQLDAARAGHAALTEAQARFIPVEVLDALGRADVPALEVGQAIERDMTILFSDIERYTALVERMSRDEARELVVGFLQAVETPILANNGFLHEVSGDEVLALFDGSPDDALRAALSMQRAKRRFNDSRVARGQPAVRWGIGINHGPLLLAMVGGVNRMKPAVIGDSINLASRVQGLNRRYGSELLLTEGTLALVSNSEDYSIRRVERVRVVNRSEPVVIFEVFDEDPDELRALKLKSADTLAQAFELYDTGRFGRAGELFEACLEIVPGDRVAELHRDRARDLARTGMPPTWDGATQLSVK